MGIWKCIPYNVDSVKRGDIIDACNPNDDGHYLILKEKEDYFYCLDMEDLEPVTIGKKWINQYHIVDSVDINKVIGFLKEE